MKLERKNQNFFLPHPNLLSLLYYRYMYLPICVYMHICLRNLLSLWNSQKRERRKESKRKTERERERMKKRKVIKTQTETELLASLKSWGSKYSPAFYSVCCDFAAVVPIWSALFLCHFCQLFCCSGLWQLLFWFWAMGSLLRPLSKRLITSSVGIKKGHSGGKKIKVEFWEREKTML